MRWLFASLLFLSLSCKGANGANYGAALSAIVMASTVSAVSVASGGCAAVCTTGTFCNAQGFCEPLPCHAACGYNEICELKPVEHCVSIQAAKAALQLDELPPPPPAASTPK